MKYLFELSTEEGKQAFALNVKKRIEYHDKAKVIKDHIHKAENRLKEIGIELNSKSNDLEMTVRTKKRNILIKDIHACEEEQKVLEQELVARKGELEQIKKDVYGAYETAPVYFGRYPQKKAGLSEPIEWHVASYNRGKVLLISKYILDHKCYHHENVDVHWSESDVRKWLNDEFYKEAFSPTERNMILEVENANPGNDGYHTEGGENTRDKVFLMSFNEANRCYAYDADRIAYATEYAKERGVDEIEETKGSYWWLRSNGGNLYNACVVNFKGYVFEYGFYVESLRYGIRPCIVLQV